jgi:hypothetical protein
VGRRILSAVLVTLLFATACGRAPTSQTPGGGGTFPSVQRVQGRIVLPPGSPLTPSSLRVWTAWDAVEPAQNGTFSILANTAGAQLFAVSNPQNEVVLLGHLGFNDQLEINADTTTVSLLMVTVPPAYRPTRETARAAYQLILQQPFFPSLRDAVAAQIQQGRLDPAASPLRDALAAALPAFWQLVSSPQYPALPPYTASSQRVRRQAVDPGDIVSGLLVEDEDTDRDGDPSTHSLTVHNYSPLSAVIWYKTPNTVGLLGIVLPRTGWGIIEAFTADVAWPNSQDVTVRIGSPPPDRYELFASMFGLKPATPHAASRLQPSDPYVALGVFTDTFVGMLLPVILQLIGPGLDMLSRGSNTDELVQCYAQFAFASIPQAVQTFITSTFAAGSSPSNAVGVLVYILELLGGPFQPFASCLLNYLVVEGLERAAQRALGELIGKGFLKLLVKAGDVAALALNIPWMASAATLRHVAAGWTITPQRTAVRWLFEGGPIAVAATDSSQSQQAPVVVVPGSQRTATGDGSVPIVWISGRGIIRLSQDRTGVWSRLDGACVSSDGRRIAVVGARSGSFPPEAIYWTNTAASVGVLNRPPSYDSTDAKGCSWVGGTLYVAGYAGINYVHHGVLWTDGFPTTVVRPQDLGIRTWCAYSPWVELHDVDSRGRVAGFVRYYEEQGQGRDCRETLRLFTGPPGTYTLSPPLVNNDLRVARMRMSSQGHVVIRADIDGWKGYLWNSNTGQLVELPFEATGISADGSRIVGERVDYMDGRYVFNVLLWENGRISRIDEIFQPFLRQGDSLLRAGGMSADGRFIAGGGIPAGHRVGWVALLDLNIARSSRARK